MNDFDNVESKFVTLQAMMKRLKRWGFIFQAVLVIDAVAVLLVTELLSWTFYGFYTILFALTIVAIVAGFCIIGVVGIHAGLEKAYNLFVETEEK